ncbi:GRB10-interacting GYF protein 2 [Pestalotiopsis sp. 9143b]|nr:GRB10-interacting GYF protein 2 [Pestalotiopsis sp. 9143b]
MCGSSPYGEQTWQTRNEGKLAALGLSGTKQTKQSYDVPREEEVRRQEQEEIYRQEKENRRREHKESRRREKEEIRRREHEQYRLREQERLNQRLREEETIRRQEQREKGKGPARVQELRHTSARDRDRAFLNLRNQTALEEFCELGRRARAAQHPYSRAGEEERQRDLAENGHLWSFDQADLLEFPHDFELCKHCDHTEHVVVSSSRYREVLARCQPRPPALYSWNAYGEREEWVVRFSLKHMRVMIFTSLGLRVKTSALAEHFANPAFNDNGVGLALDFLDRDRKLFWER